MALSVWLSMTMTDEQWQTVLTYVLKRLENENSFQINAKKMAAELGLNLPFYSELMQRLAAGKQFSIRTYIHSEGSRQEPIDDLIFSA